MTVHHRYAKVASEDAPHVVKVLHRQRLVETEFLLEFVDLFGGGLGSSGQPYRIPRYDMGDSEGHDRQTDQHRYDQQQSTY